MRNLIVLLVFLSGFAHLAKAQDAPCTREAVLASFEDDMNADEWIQQFSTCPAHIQRAVRTLAAGYQLLDSEYLPFAGAGQEGEINPIWRFYRGSSVSQVHFVDATTNTLTLIGDYLTEQRDAITTAPVLAYPVTGDVAAQVKIMFSPASEENGAGIGIRAAQDFQSWVRIARVGNNIEVTANEAGVSRLIESQPVDEGEPDIFLRIERTGDVFAFAYSIDGEAWQDIVSDYIQTLPAETELFLTTFWPNESGASAARFTEMKVD